MNSKLKLLSVAMLAVSSFSTLAAAMTQDAIKVKFESLLPFNVTEIKQAPIEGFFQVETEKGIFYASNDGKKIFSGSLHKFEEGLLNLTALRQQELTTKQLDDLQDELIVYEAPNEKYFVTVFTDPTCGYCRKLHHEMKEYNDLGITIAYAAYPRGGVNSQMSTTLNNIWCSSDQLDAMNKAKDDQYIPTVKCQSPVEKMYNLGSAMGINGTPALFLPNGELVPGYQPPKQLLMTLENQG
ncbi:bifunctional protein-disulfide isomerase/oxidoreductase DsbC (plasmid) [Shewanella sp. HL-SH4]|uniref:bifunctional protein-disulfide isomerase/oxidoreductase DsbC n=1 Tax=Shewanella TaxID=22 RepID=UPI003D7B971D